MVPNVAVIIPARNEAARITVALQSIRDQTVWPERVLVAVNNSTDDTFHVATRACADFFGDIARVQIINGGYKGHALKAAADQCHHQDVLMFMDADTRVSPNMVEAIRAEHRMGFVGGASRVISDDDSFAHRLWWRLYEIPMRMLNSAGCVVWYDSAAYWAAGGHVDTPPGFADDTILHLRVKRQGPVRRMYHTWAATDMRDFEAVGYRRMLLTWMMAGLYARLTYGVTKRHA